MKIDFIIEQLKDSYSLRAYDKSAYGMPELMAFSGCFWDFFDEAFYCAQIDEYKYYANGFQQASLTDSGENEIADWIGFRSAIILS